MTMKTVLCIAATSLIAVAACVPEPAERLSMTPDAALDLITTTQLLAHVAYLADDGRLGREAGEPGYDDSARYVVDQLTAMGVMPAGVDGWYQSVTLRKFRPDPGGAAMTIHRDGNDTVLKYRDEFSTLGDAVREASSVRAEVVYAGYGVHAPEFGYSDYDGIDVRDKVIAVFSGAPERIEGEERAYYASSSNKTQEAVDRGAIGIIGLRSRKDVERRSWDELKKRFGTRWHMNWVTESGEAARYFPQIQASGRISSATANKLFDAAPLSFEQALDASEASRIASAPLGIEVSLSQRSSHSSTTSPNVIGLVRGTDPELRDEYVVYTAHLDHVGVHGDKPDRIYNGAYDNAMGVALMLETARAIAAAPPRRSVLFIALTAEEKGLLGSDYFAQNPTVPADAIVANINLDMPLFLYPLADLVAFGSEHSTLHAAVETAAHDEGFVFSPDPIPEENLFVRSDQFSFVRQGVPAVFLVPGFTSSDPATDGEAAFRDHLKNHYHEPSDDLNRPIDWDSALRFCRAHTRIGFIVANDATRPFWNEGDFFGERYGKRND